METTIYDVAIIGSGPAGLTAAIYATRANLKTLMLSGRAWGGQLMLTTLVENFPGFPEGIMGPQLMTEMRKQALHHGAEMADVNFKQADFSKQPFLLTGEDNKSYASKSMIIATGAETKWLNVPGEKEKIGHGVSSCAPCDGPFYRGKNVVVVGGGDSAMEEAEVLSKFATHVRVVHRKDSLRASQIMQKRVFENPKISFIWNTEITQIIGEEKVESVQLSSKLKVQNKDKETAPEELGGKRRSVNDKELLWELPIDGVFVAIGHVPNSALFKGIDSDEKGFITIDRRMMTNIDGVFAAGDVHDHTYKQAVTAAGFGCQAALEAEKWLRSR